MCTCIKIVHHIIALVSEKTATNLLAVLYSLVAVVSLTKCFFPLMVASQYVFEYFQVKPKLMNIIRTKKYSWLHLKSC